MLEGGIIAPVVGKSTELACSFTYQHLQYIWKFKRNIQRLSNAIDSLEAKKNDICLRVDAAKNNTEVIGSEVKKWLEDVEAMKKEADIIILGQGQAQMGCCINCKCPNLKVRYSLSKKAETKIIEITDLQRKGEFSRVGYPAPIGQMPFTPLLKVVGFQSRMQVGEDVMTALLDENIHVIAVCGMGGVGKTTMVKTIADKIKDNHFDEVVLAVVSQNYDPINVQQQFAESLGLHFEENTLHARAERLYKRLMQQKKILLIIDDLWEEIDLHAIGIPNEVEHKGLKVLFTSRFSQVCSKMDVNKIIEVNVLTEEEAWVLFKKHANISDDSDVLEDYPKRVVNKCQGLPLAIEVIGKTLKDSKQLSEWRDALQQLESAQDSNNSEDMYDKVYSSIAWSVNYLSYEQRSLLLLFSLFPEDCAIEVEDLVRYAKGLQFLKGTEKMTETRDRVGTIIHVLRSCYLLIECDNNRVKLHDVVRDTCLRIASKGENVFMVPHSRLREWPDKETYESYTAISLDFDDLKELPSGLKCSRLQLLRLSFPLWQTNILNNLTSFLEAMEKLRVLNINNSDIELPPRSLQTSMNLRTLKLLNCSLNGDLSALLERLVKLEVLSFFHSTYKRKWPKEIAQLSNLKSLDLRFTSGPTESLPTGILIQLKKLEELYLNLELQIFLPESQEVIEEMGSLSNLNTIWISGVHSHGLALLVKKLDVERLSRFYFSPSVVRRPEYQFSRKMIVNEASMGMLLEPKMKALLSKVNEFLALHGVTGFNNDFDGGSVFCRSRILKLTNCEMKYLCNTSNSAQGVFVDLKSLNIEEAEHLEELCHGNIPPGSFARLEEVTLEKIPLLRFLWGPIKPPSLGNLTSLTIHGSKMITSLFLRSSLKCFVQLRLIEIKSCPNLETLVSFDGQIENDTVEDRTEFPKLEELYLENVDSFKTLGYEPEAPNTVLLCGTNSNISLFPKLRVLLISRFARLHVCNEIKNTHNLSSLEMAYCDSLEVCFDFEGWHKEITEGEVAERVFHNLHSLTLDRLPNLKHLLKNLSEGTVAFPKLFTLKVSDCGGLRYLLTPLMVKIFARLRKLEIHNCEQMEAIIGSEEADEVTTIEEEILLPELRKLKLWELPKLRMICSEPANISLPYWNYLYLARCPKINRSCNGNMIAPELKEVTVFSYHDDGEIFNGEVNKMDLETLRKLFTVIPTT